MDNALAPLNINALRAAASGEPRYNDLASMLRAKQMMYASMGVSPRDMQPLMELEMRRDPRIAMMLMGNSGNLMRDRTLGEVSGVSPAMLMARLGLENNGARAGVSGMAVKTPMGIKTMPGAVDVGYSAPLMGGNVDVGGYYGLAPSPMPNYGVNLRYSKEF
jgi:hypothetical protein